VKATTRSDYLDRIRRVLRFVQVNLDAPLDPERLADVANLSVFHFHRIFSGLVGETLGEHVRRLRLERAAGELRRTNFSVLDIALRAGYEAHEPFTRAFRDRFGMPPSAYRKVDEPLAFPPALCSVHFGSDVAVSRFVPLQEDSNMIEVRIEKLPARRLLALTHTGAYETIGQSFEKVVGAAATAGLLGSDVTAVGIYYDNPDMTPQELLCSHAGVIVQPGVRPEPDGFELLELDAGEFAIGVHRGPYRTLPGSYQWLFGQWLPSSGREPAHAPVQEVYVNDARSTPEDQLVTHICIPLANQVGPQS
jgi:AraC family transcriptional regulator